MRALRLPHSRTIRLVVACLLAGLAAVALGARHARATPNERCPGLCPDGETACGNHADCEGAECKFDDACLPGLAPLIEEALPEGPRGLDDPGAWSCGFLDCALDPTDATALSVGSTYGIGAFAVKDLVLEPGRRYLIRAEMRADADTWGYLDVASDFVAARSDDVTGPADWHPVTIAFDLPPSSAALQLRLHAEGAGRLGLRNAVVLVIGDYGVWLRFSLLEPSVPATFEDGFVLRHADDALGLHPTICPDGEAPSATCIDPALAIVPVPAGAPSAWVEVARMFSGGDRATHAWRVLDADGLPFDEPIRVKVEVAYRPDEGSILWSREQAPGFSGVGLVLPVGRPAPTAILRHTAFVRDLVGADREALATPAAARPSSFAVGTVVRSVDAFDAWGPLAGPSLELLAALGLDVQDFMTALPRPEDRARAAELGLTHRLVPLEGLMGDIAASRDLDLDAIRAAVRARLAEPTVAAEVQALAAAPEQAFVRLGDARVGPAFAGPRYAEAFHAWLATEAADLELTPADLGVASFDEVAPLEDARPATIAAQRPDPQADPQGARRYGLALRFWSVATGRAYAAARDELEAAVGQPVAAALDSGTPLAAGDLQYATGAEYQTLALERGVAGFFGDGFLDHRDDCLAWDLGFYADWAAGEVEPWTSGSTRPTMATYLHADRGDAGRKMLELAPRGFTWFCHHAYGPYDLTLDEGAGGLGAASLPWLDRVARGSELLAAAEPVLVGARRPAASIVMLGSQSDSTWTDLGAATPDELGWHMALVQSHYPVDLMMEGEVEAGRLEGPAARKRLLFVLREHVSRKAFTAIERWVEGGGVVVLGPDLAVADEHGQVDLERADWLAVAPGPVHPASDLESFRWATEQGLATFFYDGAWRELIGIGGSTLAESSEGRTVALRLPRGRGLVIALGARLGEAYRAPMLGCESRPGALPPRYPDVFADGLRAVMTSIPATLGLDDARPVWSDDPRLSLQAVDGPSGPAVVVVAWTNEHVDAALTSRRWRGCSRVHDAIGDVDLPVIFGTVIAPIDRAAVLSWDPSECEVPVVVEADAVAEAEVVTPPADDGCATGAASGALALAAALLVLAGLARRRGA